jgi:hypothetical protein
MAYCTRAEIEAQVPAAQVAKALGTEGEALLAAIIAGADLEVEARLAPVATPPYSPVPAIVRRASLLFACETLWRRVGVSGEQSNPFAAAANRMRDLLDDIAEGSRSIADSAIASFEVRSSIFANDVSPATEYNLGEEV